MQQRRVQSDLRVPLRPLRVVIEDRDLAAAPLADCDTAGMDVRVCSGPVESPGRCPLVTDGLCPIGSADVVVCGLEGEWERPVVRAWQQAGAIVIRPTGSPAADPTRRFHTYLGAALGAVWATDRNNVEPPA